MTISSTTSSQNMESSGRQMNSKGNPLADEDEIQDDPVFTQGDFTVITADHVRFRVPSFHLLSSSSVFRDLVSAGGDQDKTITFVDPELESAATFRQYLALVIDGRVKSFDKELEGLRQLVLFLAKWDCNPPTRIILLDIREQLRLGTVHPIKAFTVGAAADDPTTCALALETITWAWNAGPEDELAGGTTKALSTHPLHMPYNLWSLIPPSYMWALARAWGKCGGGGAGVQTDKDLDKLGSLSAEFMRLLELAKKGERSRAHEGRGQQP